MTNASTAGSGAPTATGAAADPTVPPVAKRVPTERTHHGDTVVDEYAWLANKDDPDTVAYLEAENGYTEARTAHLADLREKIFTEIKTRTQETDLSVPARKGDWWYLTRTVEGKQYSIHCRCPAGDPTLPGAETPPTPPDDAPLPGEQVLLDENELAGDSDFFSLGAFEISPDGRLLAYSTDYAGNERFTLRVRDLTTGEDLPDEIPDTFYGVAWSADNSTLFYMTVDEAWRPYRVFRHQVGSPAGTTDTLVHEETDERFWVGAGLTRSERYIVIDLHSKVTSEVLVIDAADPTAAPRKVWPRRQGVEYMVDHHGPTGRGSGADPGTDNFLILHNDPERGGGINFAVASVPVDAPDDWTPLVPHRDDTRLMDVDAFADHVVVHFRRDGLTGLRVLPAGATAAPTGDAAVPSAPAGAGAPWEIKFPEPLYSVDPAGNPEYRTGMFRLRYTSLVTPTSVYDCDVSTGELLLRKQEPVLGGYSPQAYEQHREWATAPDGTKVPISIVCRAGTPRDGSAPCVLYGYGSYETSMDPWFSIVRLSLVDRGFLFAVAHVRGGGEMGRQWYEDGKLLSKKNTFSDFTACAEHLAKSGWTAVDRLIARGGSAGGLLMGAVANMAPEAFRGIVAEVPFVDALTTILDPSLPLTVTEWEEWGDPLHDPEVYAYFKSYAPYENVAARPYPAILAVTSLNDTRVLFAEPAKWVAKLRAVAGLTDGLLLKTEMGAGHGGPSGRYNAWREQAFVLSWIIDQAGAPHDPLPLP